MVDTKEKVLRECVKIYTDPQVGLIRIARDLGIVLDKPKKTVKVLLIGNHSAGKSSFINWYVGEPIQKTSVAVETNCVSLVTHGMKRESLLGGTSMLLFPELKPLAAIDGFVDYLNTEVSSTSFKEEFKLVTLIDTPGLVDADGVKYPIDVDKALIELGNHANLIFVFFDPFGQALCKRTLNIVEQLNQRHGNKMHFFLTKCDTIERVDDRQVSSSVFGPFFNLIIIINVQFVIKRKFWSKSPRN